MRPCQPGNFILVGDVGSGKSTLVKALFSHDEEVTKTQALEFHGDNVIDSPGEFISRRYLYGALLDSIVGVDTIVYLLAADQARAVMPADLLGMYGDKRVLGVVSKCDLPGADIERAEQCLLEAGIAPPYYHLSIDDAASVEALARHLCDLQQSTEKLT